MDELGQALINIVALTPKGMVVFVPSYDFLDQIQSRWEKTGARQRLATKKDVRYGDQAELLLCFCARTDDGAIRSSGSQSRAQMSMPSFENTPPGMLETKQ